MALQAFPNQQGFLLFPGIGHDLAGPVGMVGTTDTGMTSIANNAVGESTGYVGKLFWHDGSSHTVSSAGGKIFCMFDTVTFADAGTTIRIGIQDVASGLEDGTFDVFDDLVGVTDTITADVIKTVTMSSGTKTIAHAATVAVVIEMTARGGTDSVSPFRVNRGGGFPYVTLDTGTLAKNTTWPYVMVEADDGAVGFFHPLTIPSVMTLTSFTNASTPDEYAMLFQVPFACTVNALMVCVGEVDAGETALIQLYSDPTGTPTVMTSGTATFTHDGDTFGSITSTGVALYAPIPETTLSANTTYAVGYQATSAGSRDILRVTSAPTNARKATPFGVTLQGGTRSDNTGAFTTSDTDWPCMGLVVNKLSDTTSGGGGPLVSGRLVR